MVQSLNFFSVAAAAVAMSSATAFSPARSASFGVSSRPLSSSPLQASATTLDAPPSNGGGVVLDRPVIAEPDTQKRDESTRRDMAPNGDWVLRIYNDNVNTREYVAVCLVQVVGVCESRAYFTMQDAHHNGIAKVGEYNQEVAECYEEQLNERGIMCDVVNADGE